MVRVITHMEGMRRTYSVKIVLYVISEGLKIKLIGFAKRVG
jgi:hypothetical protein